MLAFVVVAVEQLGGQPHRRADQEALAAGPDAADHYVDVTDTFGRKLAALRAHESQTGHTDDLADRIRTRLAMAAQRAGLPDGRLAEGFRVLDTA